MLLLETFFFKSFKVSVAYMAISYYHKNLENKIN